MAATFPSGVKSFTTKTDGVDKIYAAHINDIQDEVTAIETELTKTTGSVVDHGALTGLGDNDHPQYSLTTHDHDSDYLGITAKAANSDKLDGLDSSAFVQSSALGVWQNWDPTLDTGDTILSDYTVARYCLVGKLVHFIFSASNKDLSGSSGEIEVGLPVQAGSCGEVRFTAFGYPISSTYAAIMAKIFSSSTEMTIAKGLFSEPWSGTETGVYIIVNGFYEAK